MYFVYATLIFIFVIDQSESELGILDLIHVMVEAFDHVFENVCELVLIFHTDKVHHIVDEIVMGGTVLETHLQDILTAVREQEELDAKASRDTPTAQRPMRGGLERGRRVCPSVELMIRHAIKKSRKRTCKCAPARRRLLRCSSHAQPSECERGGGERDEQAHTGTLPHPHHHHALVAGARHAVLLVLHV
jgi:hypothetical protein